MLKNSHLLSHDELEWMINSHLLCKNRPINPIYPFHSILLLLHNTFVDLLWVIHAYHPTYVLRSLVLPLFFISIINISRCMMMGGIVDGKQIFNGSWQAKMTGLIMYLIALKMFLTYLGMMAMAHANKAQIWIVYSHRQHILNDGNGLWWNDLIQLV